MDDILKDAFVAGYERLSAWSDLLDEINVFPVADGDTGRNLKITLLPLGRMDRPPEALSHDLILGATGNSGNIAASFFAEMLKATCPEALADAVAAGKMRAWQAVSDPQPGSMLTVYAELAAALHNGGKDSLLSRLDIIINRLAESVAATVDMLPALKRAGVVDAGALGMFIYFEAFLGCLAMAGKKFRDLPELFSGRLSIKENYYTAAASTGVCVSAVVRPKEFGKSHPEWRADIGGWADSVVVSAERDCVKVHLHTEDPAAARGRIDLLGEIAHWSEEVIEEDRKRLSTDQKEVLILTDAAGSLPREDAEALGITLLESCIIVDGRKSPETLLAPEEVYAAMAKGIRVSTAQASRFQRYQALQSAISRHAKVLYLCVGSAYTGNYENAKAFANQYDSEGRLTVLDTGAASGRLGIIARRTALYTEENPSLEAVCAYARKAMALSCEYIFLDQLKYLAAGGRISKTGGFFGDLLGIKPIITPKPEGAVKTGTARSREDQLNFACDKLATAFARDAAPHILLQFSNNQAWVRQEALPAIQGLLPQSRILVRPLSLTSGAHMGPGTWGMAYLPEQIE